MRVKMTEEERKARANFWQAAYRARNKERLAIRKAAYYAKNREKIVKQKAEHRAENKENESAYRAAYRVKNKENIAERKAAYYIKNKENILAQNAAYRDKNKEKVAVLQATYYTKNINHRIGCIIRNRIKKAIKRGNGQNALKSIDLLNCSISHARQHLESQFLPGMTWENHSPDGWHIDHIKPCSSFDLTDPEQQKICFHYTNLQPLWATDNLSKGKKVDWQPQRQSAQP